ncbi:RE1-silencing transcription factor-like [Leptopilina boulardi]|uniref:RE1-silencing transcription factor-like n=1 Tax=Leptopilina boulardi TaxID=63433 RepID=UPI0021F669A2|nr:RE1-silencing transcription factor-like [Leptopilina boulardi]
MQINKDDFVYLLGEKLKTIKNQIGEKNEKKIFEIDEKIGFKVNKTDNEEVITTEMINFLKNISETMIHCKDLIMTTMTTIQKIALQIQSSKLTSTDPPLVEISSPHKKIRRIPNLISIEDQLKEPTPVAVTDSESFLKIENVVSLSNISEDEKNELYRFPSNFAMQNQIQTKIEIKRKFDSKFVSEDKINPNSLDKKNSNISDVVKTCFSPNEINLLPLQSIFQQGIQCALCPFTTIFRSNILRHLQLHIKNDDTISESGPIHSDESDMENFTNNSYQNELIRIKSNSLSLIQTNKETLSKYNHKNKRYICGISKCSYVTVNEDMLLCHLRALHSNETIFKNIIHCKEQENNSIEKMEISDSKLYKCSYCNYFHYQRHILDHHLENKHADKKPFVQIVREFIESNKNKTPLSPHKDNNKNTSNQNKNQWKCNSCDYHCYTKWEMQIHASNYHDEKKQFKCTACSYRTHDKIRLEQHLITKHVNADFQMVYQKINDSKKKVFNSMEREKNFVDESLFNKTPLWQKDKTVMVKHIWDILHEEDSASKISSPRSLIPEKSVKRKNVFDIPSKQAKIRCIH